MPKQLEQRSDDRPTARAPTNHVIMIDGAWRSDAAEAETETHVGRLFSLIWSRELTFDEAAPIQHVWRHPGVQGVGWREWWSAVTGYGLNEAIIAAYGALARRYRPCDRIFLFGYGRGAYAVRSLAGMIDRVGLLRSGRASERRIARAFDHYRATSIGSGAVEFRRRHCHARAEVEMIGAWDTVKALGPPAPAFSGFGRRAAHFHDVTLGPSVRAAYHALALDEDRAAFEPVLWRRAADWPGALEQAWFPGGHEDIGGEQDAAQEPSTLANLPFVWMLERAEAHGLRLPEGWRGLFPCDPAAPMTGTRAGMEKLFLARKPRQVGETDGERVHVSVRARMAHRSDYRPGDCSVVADRRNRARFVSGAATSGGDPVAILPPDDTAAMLGAIAPQVGGESGSPSDLRPRSSI